MRGAQANPAFPPNAKAVILPTEPMSVADGKPHTHVTSPCARFPPDHNEARWGSENASATVS